MTKKERRQFFEEKLTVAKNEWEEDFGPLSFDDLSLIGFMFYAGVAAQLDLEIERIEHGKEL